MWVCGKEQGRGVLVDLYAPHAQGSLEGSQKDG